MARSPHTSCARSRPRSGGWMRRRLNEQDARSRSQLATGGRARVGIALALAALCAMMPTPPAGAATQLEGRIRGVVVASDTGRTVAGALGALPGFGVHTR